MYIERHYENSLKIHIYEKILRLVTKIRYSSLYDNNTLSVLFGINIIIIRNSYSCSNSYCMFTFDYQGANELMIGKRFKIELKNLVKLMKFEFQIYF